MAMKAREISAILDEMAVLLEITGANPFRARAYGNAARIVKNLTQDVAVLAREGQLSEIKGIGAGLAANISELVETGRLADHDELKAKTPAGLLDIVKLPGLGPKRVKTIYEDLEVTNIGELEYACRENRLAALAGFGEKTQVNVLKAIEFYVQGSDRHLYHRAREAADGLVALVSSCPGVLRCEVAGSLRRHRETIGDLDVLASAADDARDAIMDAFTGHAEVADIVARGDTKSSVRLKSGIAADLRIVSDEEYPFALAYFTGSKEHNTALRSRAKKRGLRLNEYRLHREDGDDVPCADEAALYEALELSYVEPELREDLGEIEAAEAGALPRLIERPDMLGMLHVHTQASDGANTLEQLAAAATERGATYLGICDHSQSAVYAGGLTPDEVQAQWDAIDELNERLDGITVLKGIESDIRADGSLDYDDALLDGFDFVVASVHSRFGMNEQEAGERLLRAMDHPATTILGHPTGRLLLAREGYAIDYEAVIAFASERGVAIELNASPHRLDLDWRWCRRARELGAAIAVNTDAHSIDGLDDLDIGVAVARKGWLESKDVLNTFTVDEFRSFVAAKRTR